jgi:thiol:disulfide interchange protein
VCNSCLENDYTYAYSRRGNEYYIRNDDVIRVNDEWYDINYLSDNSIVELHDGEYEHSDYAVYIESADAYYHVDDDDICYTEDTNEYELKDNCWQCTESGNYYTDDEESVEIDGDLYHPDHAPEPEEEDDEEVETSVEAEAETVAEQPAKSESAVIIDTIFDERFSLAA